MTKAPLLEEIGPERFKSLLGVTGVATKKAVRKALRFRDEQGRDALDLIAEGRGITRRTVRRAVSDLIERESALSKYGLEEMTDEEMFDQLPEIREMTVYLKSGGTQTPYRKKTRGMLKDLWKNALDKKRPGEWGEDEIRKALAYVREEKQVSIYGWKGSLKRLFEALKKYELSKNRLLTQKRSDMRPPLAKQKIKGRDYLEVEEYRRIKESDQFTAEEKFIMAVHITTNAREGSTQYSKEQNASLLWMRWEHYNPEKGTFDILEPKKGGSQLWRGCPLGLFEAFPSEQMKRLWEEKGRPNTGYVWDWTYRRYRKLWLRISEFIGLKLTPHEGGRNTHATWLRESDVDVGAILGEYNARTGLARGVCGVGWESADNFFSRYGRVTPKKERKARRLAGEILA